MSIVNAIIQGLPESLGLDFFKLVHSLGSPWIRFQPLNCFIFVSLETWLALLVDSSEMHCFYACKKYDTSLWPLGLYRLMQLKILLHVNTHKDIWNMRWKNWWTDAFSADLFSNHKVWESTQISWWYLLNCFCLIFFLYSMHPLLFPLGRSLVHPQSSVWKLTLLCLLKSQKCTLWESLCTCNHIYCGSTGTNQRKNLQ